jgi:hypothetical protein
VLPNDLICTSHDGVVIACIVLAVVIVSKQNFSLEGENRDVQPREHYNNVNMHAMWRLSLTSYITSELANRA